LTGQRGTLQAAALEVLADGALGNANAMPGEEDGANLGSRTRRQLDAESARLVEQLRMTTDGTQVGAWIRFEAVQALLAIGAQPAIERAAGVVTLRPVGVLVGLVRQGAHDRAAFSGTEPRTDGFGNDAVTEQCDGFGGRGGHGGGPPGGDARIQSAPR